MMPQRVESVPGVSGVPRPQIEDEAKPPEVELQQVEVHTARPVLPIVALVIRLRPELQMIGVHTQPVMAAVAHDVVLARDLVREDTVDEAIGRYLTPVELDGKRSSCERKERSLSQFAT
jgi:hypothetical protein